MTTKQINIKFENNLHPSLKNKLFLNILEYSYDTEEGIVEFLDENFDTLVRFEPPMFKHLYWFLSNPEQNYTKALNSDKVYDNILAIINKNTGSRVLDDWKNHKFSDIRFFYDLRKKYQ